MMVLGFVAAETQGFISKELRATILELVANLFSVVRDL